ncbi:MAG: FixH family protein [Syntrophales bacterium]
MKRIILILMGLFLSAGLAYGTDYEVTKKAGDYTVQVKIDRNPPVVGNNNIMIWLKDAAGNDVKGAIMTVDYSKPTKKFWTSAKKYNTYAQPHENNYHAILEIPAQGSWDVTININHQGKRVSTMFRIEVK